MENRGGKRPGAGRKSKGDTTPICCRITTAAKERLQEIAKQRAVSITAVLEELILREG